MIKELFTKTTHSLRFTEETRKKVNDFLFELTGLTNISEIIIKPHGMYIETTNQTENTVKPQIVKATFNDGEHEIDLSKCVSIPFKPIML